MSLAAKIPATVVTGFLGAGKTTLIRHLLERRGRRIALIINEFGDLGVDREMLHGCGRRCSEEDIVELANGCICCTVADDFLPTMQALLDARAARAYRDRDLGPGPAQAADQGLQLAGGADAGDGRRRGRGGRAAAVRDGRFADDPEAVAAQRAADPALDHESPLEELFEEQLTAAD